MVWMKIKIDGRGGDWIKIMGGGWLKVTINNVFLMGGR